MNFDEIQRQQIRVTIKSKTYWLVEASADAVVKYRNANLAAAKMNQRGNFVSLGNVNDSEPMILSLCLHLADESGQLKLLDNGNPDPSRRVSEEFVRGLTNREQKRMFDWLKNNSDLHEKPEETIAQLRKKMREDRKKLAELEGREEDEEEVSKNSQDVTTAS